MAEARNVYIQTLCSQVLLQLQTILLREKIICKESKNSNSKMWDVIVWHKFTLLEKNCLYVQAITTLLP